MASVYVSSTIPPHRHTERKNKYMNKKRIAKGIMILASFFAFGAALYGTIYVKEAIDQKIFMGCAVGLFFAPVRFSLLSYLGLSAKSSFLFPRRNAREACTSSTLST